MTLTSIEAGESAADAAFRAEVREWLEANATRRSTDSAEVKRRLLRSESADDERAHAETCKQWQQRIFDAGLAGLTVPVEYGGRGGTPAQQRIWSTEAAGYDVDTGVFSVGIGMVLPTLLVHGTEDQKRRFVPPLLRGEEIWCQLFSEPGAGSDLAGLTTRADRDGDEWVVNGQKVWNSFAHLSDWGILLARTNWDVPKHRGITYFLVDMRSPGIEVRPLRQITGAAHFNETFLTDVRIPDANRVGEVDGGWGVTLTTLMNERTLIGGGLGGVGFGDFLDLARRFDRTCDLAVRQRLAGCYTRAQILVWMGQRAQAAAKAGRATGSEGSLLKLAITEHVIRNGDLALALEGPAGMLAGADAPETGFWQQQFLGQWGVRLGGGTEQIQRNVIGERVLGLPAEARLDKTLPFREIPRNA